jgi:hypothetical protein
MNPVLTSFIENNMEDWYRRLVYELDFYIPLCMMVWLLFVVFITLTLRMWIGKAGDKGWWKVLDIITYVLGFITIAYWILRTLSKE